MVFYQDNQLLFYEGDLDATLRTHHASIKDKVDSLPKDQFLASTEDAIVEHIQSSMRIEPIQLHEDSMVMDQQEVKVDVSHNRDRNPFGDRGPIYVSGVKVTVSVPFTGDKELWRLRPNQWQNVFPRGNIRHPGSDGIGYLDIVIEQPSDEGSETVKYLLEDTLKSVRFYLESQKRQIDQHNAGLANVIRQSTQNRRSRIKAHDNIAEALDIPLKRREGSPEIKPIQVERKLVRPLPPAPEGGYKPEPGITNEDYEHILSVIRHEGRTFESTPNTFAVHDEEQLRDIILAHLNGHYKGGATGETFRRSGKTDIRIEDKDRAAFVAECKIWRGAKELLSAVDQLLGYLTWRDCKAAIVIVNKQNARFMELLQKVPEALAAHPHVKKNLDQHGDSEWRYVFTSEEDEMRQVYVHMFLFNLFVKPK